MIVASYTVKVHIHDPVDHVDPQVTVDDLTKAITDALDTLLGDDTYRVTATGERTDK